MGLNKRWIKGFFIGASILMGLNGCSDDPLSVLKSDSFNDHFDEAFWNPQYKQKTVLWREAVQYCLPHADKPNCKPVLALCMFGDGHKKAPKIGESGESIHLVNA